MGLGSSKIKKLSSKQILELFFRKRKYNFSSTDGCIIVSRIVLEHSFSNKTKLILLDKFFTNGGNLSKNSKNQNWRFYRDILSLPDVEIVSYLLDKIDCDQIDLYYIFKRGDVNLFAKTLELVDDDDSDSWFINNIDNTIFKNSESIEIYYDTIKYLENRLKIEFRMSKREFIDYHATCITDLRLLWFMTHLDNRITHPIVSVDYYLEAHGVVPKLRELIEYGFIVDNSNCNYHSYRDLCENRLKLIFETGRARPILFKRALEVMCVNLGLTCGKTVKSNLQCLKRHYVKEITDVIVSHDEPNDEIVHIVLD